MAASGVPNGENTRFTSGEVAARNGSKGGKATSRKNKEKKKLTELINAVLDKRVKSDKKATELAQKYGIADAKNIKELFVAISIYNSMSRGDLSAIEQLMRLLGEEKGGDGGRSELDKLCEAIRAAGSEGADDG